MLLNLLGLLNLSYIVLKWINLVFVILLFCLYRIFFTKINRDIYFLNNIRILNDAIIAELIINLWLG